MRVTEHEETWCQDRQNPAFILIRSFSDVSEIVWLWKCWQEDQFSTGQATENYMSVSMQEWKRKVSVSCKGLRMTNSHVCEFTSGQKSAVKIYFSTRRRWWKLISRNGKSISTTWRSTANLGDANSSRLLNARCKRKKTWNYLSTSKSAGKLLTHVDD